ncbi:MAG: C40 family peptidase [Acidobacteriia bacterium]|nr:C40 family peptidase [Terriglobia bacterium]
MLNSEEGQAIVTAAWEHQQQIAGKPDCSHLVHEIYRLAGFPYAYASSFDLYSGGGHFARVHNAQPGDLIVWPGHVGLVVDPAEHSFYSSVNTGLETEDYSAPYWRGYGTARFYRYRTEESGNVPLAAARPGPRKAPEPVQMLTVPVINTGDDEPDPMLHTSGPSARTARESARAAVSSRAREAEPSSFEVPPSIQLVTRHGKPTREEVAEALSELSNASQNILRTGDPLQPRLPVVIFDRLRVERVQFKGERGWAEVRIESRAALGGGTTAARSETAKMDRKNRQEKRRWELRRTASGWTALTPLERAYVPRDAAVRILAEQLARLAAKDSSGPPAPATLRQEAQLASVLNDLLREK